eukprot:7558512-Prorocentrum_lima.AAC.1
MTSSLVGSEMCIRDSLSPGEPAALESKYKFGEQMPTPPGHPNWEACSESVSYTHLTLPTICSV